MNRIDRLFGIATLLQSKKYVLADKIAEQFGISIRTVYRDIRALSEQGIPVSFEQNRGYFLVQGYFLPPVSFTPEEANAFLLLEKIMLGFTDKSIQGHYTTALNKVKAVLQSPEKDRLDQLSSHIKINISDYQVSDFNYLATLQSAISGRHTLDVAYNNSSRISSRRQVEPIGLVFYGAAWHMIAWCHLRNGYRDFKVERVTRLTATGKPFSIDKHMTLNEYITSLKLTDAQMA